jgi:hypothetical protein
LRYEFDRSVHPEGAFRSAGAAVEERTPAAAAAPSVIGTLLYGWLGGEPQTAMGSRAEAASRYEIKMLVLDESLRDVEFAAITRLPPTRQR